MATQKKEIQLSRGLLHLLEGISICGFCLVNLASVSIMLSRKAMKLNYQDAFNLFAPIVTLPCVHCATAIAQVRKRCKCWTISIKVAAGLVWIISGVGIEEADFEFLMLSA